MLHTCAPCCACCDTHGLPALRAVQFQEQPGTDEPRRFSGRIPRSGAKAAAVRRAKRLFSQTTPFRPEVPFADAARVAALQKVREGCLIHGYVGGWVLKCGSEHAIRRASRAACTILHCLIRSGSLARLLSLQTTPFRDTCKPPHRTMPQHFALVPRKII